MPRRTRGPLSLWTSCWTGGISGNHVARYVSLTWPRRSGLGVGLATIASVFPVDPSFLSGLDNSPAKEPFSGLLGGRLALALELGALVAVVGAQGHAPPHEGDEEEEGDEHIDDLLELVDVGPELIDIHPSPQK